MKTTLLVPLPSQSNLSDFGPVHGFGLARERYAAAAPAPAKAPAAATISDEYGFVGGMGLANSSL
ncbi:MAG TPA: hypothetical protein VH951_01075 [Dehalococcoidia bacterium]